MPGAADGCQNPLQKRPPELCTCQLSRRGMDVAWLTPGLFDVGARMRIPQRLLLRCLTGVALAVGVATPSHAYVIFNFNASQPIQSFSAAVGVLNPNFTYNPSESSSLTLFIAGLLALAGLSRSAPRRSLNKLARGGKRHIGHT